MNHWHGTTLTAGEGVSFELNHSDLSNDHSHIDSNDHSSIESASHHSAKEITTVMTSSSSANLEQYLSSLNEAPLNSNATTPWLELSRNKCTLDDLLRANVGETFAIMDSEVPLNNEGAILQRRIIVKETEERDGDPEVWKVMDEHNVRFIENIICDYDHGLCAEWEMHYCRPTTKHIEDAEHDLFQENQPPTFPDLPSTENPNEVTNASEKIVSFESNQGSTSVTENVDNNEVSPERSKLRKQSFKHLQKQAQQMIKRAHLKGGSINVGDVVQIGVSAVDLAKTDCKNLTLMAVEERTFKKNPPLYRLANKLFQLKTLYGPG